MSELAINLNLHPRQGDAFLTPATEVLYGGAAGGGKSHLMRAAAIIWCSEIPGLQVYLFRRLYDDLVKNHVEGPSGFREMLSDWVLAGLVEIVSDEIRFWNGSKIYLCHCKDEKHRFKYQGSEIHVLMMDEATHFSEVIYRFLRSRVRMVGIELPERYEGVFPRILCGSNPGNIGHLFFKAMFLDGAEPMSIRQMPDSEGGMRRQFIPARLADNPSMEKDDPSYKAKLLGLGSEALVKALSEGDWDVVEGAYFDCWTTSMVVRPCPLPSHWGRFRSMDWGSAAPFSVGWWAVASEDFIHPDGVVIPKNALIRYREWYGASGPNVGLKMTAEAVAEGIVERERDDPGVMAGVLDPAAFAQDGGPSIAERMAARKVYFRRADNKRVGRSGAMGGWDQMRARMIGQDGKPMIYVFSTCVDSIRTIPALQHDTLRPEDVNTDQEDHAGDEWRYACMSRPYTAPAAAKDPDRDRWGDDDERESADWKTI